MSQLKELIRAFKDQHANGENRDLASTRSGIQQMLGENEVSEAIVAIRAEKEKLTAEETRLLYAMMGALIFEPGADNTSIQPFLVALTRVPPEQV